jgi:hypothetical protein
VICFGRVPRLGYWRFHFGSTTAVIRLCAASLFALCMTATNAAFATPGFPKIVESHYGVGSLPESPNGCVLCHMTDVGGQPETLRALGRTLYADFGVRAYADTQLEMVLGQIDAMYPGVACNIRGGVDPNGNANASCIDGGSDASSMQISDGLPQDLVPQYGCSIGARQTGRGCHFAWIAMMVFFWRRRRASLGPKRLRRATEPLREAQCNTAPSGAERTQASAFEPPRAAHRAGPA